MAVPRRLLPPKIKTFGGFVLQLSQKLQRKLVVVPNENLGQFRLDCAVVGKEGQKGDVSLSVLGFDRLFAMAFPWRQRPLRHDQSFTFTIVVSDRSLIQVDVQRCLVNRDRIVSDALRPLKESCDLG